MNKYDIRNLIKTNNPIILEIGCADGGDTIEFIKTFNDLQFKMYCFEPEPKNIRLFKNKIKDQRVRLYEYAISNKNSENEIFYWSNTSNLNNLSYSSSLRKPKEHLKIWPDINFDMTLKIQTKTLDTFIEEESIDLIDFIWADVQGTEDMLIEGGLLTLNNKVKYFYTEYYNDEVYEGEKPLSVLLSLLPNFELITDFGTDVLLKNKNIKD